MDGPFVFCHQCSYWSEKHDACFHPNTWRQGVPFKEPGDCHALNWNYHCKLYEFSPVVPDIPAEPEEPTLWRKIWEKFGL